MGRCKAFDVDEALDRAVALFREKGYEATSVADLTERLGIGRQSLYDTFGDKESLFLRVLERYAEAGRAAVGVELLSEDASMPALRRYFDSLVRFLTPEHGPSGCLFTVSIVEAGATGEDIGERCRLQQRELLGALRTALCRAQERGELRSGLDPAEVAWDLLSQAQGLSVLARNGVGRSRLRRVARQHLDSLSAESAGAPERS